jgi:hypothetical protein
VTHGFATLKAALLVEHGVFCVLKTRERKRRGRKNGWAGEGGKDNRGFYNLTGKVRMTTPLLMTRQRHFPILVCSAFKSAQRPKGMFMFLITPPPFFLRFSILHHFGFRPSFSVLCPRCVSPALSDLTQSNPLCHAIIRHDHPSPPHRSCLPHRESPLPTPRPRRRHRRPSCIRSLGWGAVAEGSDSDPT